MDCCVSVKALDYVDYATEITLEPISVMDWELINVDAISLENGKLLQQISVVYCEQIIELNLSTGGICRLKVLSNNFYKKTDSIKLSKHLKINLKNQFFRIKILFNNLQTFINL